MYVVYNAVVYNAVVHNAVVCDSETNISATQKKRSRAQAFKKSNHAIATRQVKTNTDKHSQAAKVQNISH